MKIDALECNNCHSVIFSRARHDFRWCACKRIAIDGGFDYCKISGNPQDVGYVSFELDVTKEQLHNDWSKIKNKYGLYIPGSAKYRKLKLTRETK